MSDASNFIPKIIRNTTSPEDSSRIMVAIWGENASKRRAEVNVYLSTNGGTEWIHVLQDVSTQWVSELSCAFGPNSSAYVVTGASKRSGKQRGHEYGKMHVFRSSDNGLTWEGPATGPFIDWTSTTVDASQSSNRGSVYIFGSDIIDNKGGWIGPAKPMIKSINNGRTFSEPSFSGKWPDDGGGFPIASRVIQDGMIVTLYKRDRPSGNLVAISNNGGDSFEMMPVIKRDSLVSKQSIFEIGFAIDQSGGTFNGRFYIAYAAIRLDKPVVMLSYSDDYGRTWQHRLISNYLDRNITKYRGATSIAVNKDGIIGVTWIEPESNSQRFIISRNGGDSFETPISLSNGVSTRVIGSQFFENHLQTMGRYEPDVPRGVPPASAAKGIGLSIRILPAGSPTIELSVDAAGVFHPVWIEQQEDGSFELFTKTISVTNKKKVSPKVDIASLKNVNEKIVVDIVGQQFDASKGIFKIDFSLTNISDSTFVGPIVLKIIELESGFGFSEPIILNSENDNTGIGAIFNLTNAVSINKLKPGIATTPYQMIFKVNQTKPGRAIWQSVKEHNTIHPISSQFDIYIGEILYENEKRR